MHYRNIP